MAKKYDTEFMNYNNAKSYYIEVFVNVKRVIRIKGITEKQAILRTLKKEQNRSWNKYEFVDCDYNVVDYNKFNNFRKGGVNEI
tara:strand:+ start:533 stop:781 length:249 start_codon:yes stop_codon:yes gene_type:complete